MRSAASSPHMPSRRRFLLIAAAFAAHPAGAAEPAQVWQGRALGSDARIVLAGAGREAARRVFAQVEHVLGQIERQFSLHRDSVLVRLNRTGRSDWPAPEVRSLFALAGRVHAATGGAFDPTVQPLWRAIAEGGDVAAARAAVGWDGVEITPEVIRLRRPGMALTFNGIAQGYAADRIAAILRKAGYRDVLTDMGEIVASGERPGGGTWRASVALPDGSQVARLDLADTALATSAPGGTRIGPAAGPHILDPAGGVPRWHLVSVAAPDAALADALSTAFCVMDRTAITTALGHFPGARLAALV